MAKLLGKKWLEVSKRIQEITAQALGKEELLILERHLKTLDTRAQLHVGAGLGFYERYKHACKDWSGQVYLVQPRVLSKEDSAWSFPGGGRLILSIDLKDGACTPVPEHVPASYVNTIKGAWRADEGRTRLENAKSEGLVYKKDTGLAKVKANFDNDDPVWEVRDDCFEVISYYISSPLALYRMLCLFPDLEIGVYDLYKCLWDFRVAHRASGFRFNKWEHKGALNVNIVWDDSSPWADCFKSEACALLELLLSDACQHPCGVVAGSVEPSLIANCSTEKQTRKYLVDPPMIATDRLGQEDYDVADGVSDKWTPLREPDMSSRSGDARLDVTFHPSSGKISVGGLSSGPERREPKRMKAEVSNDAVPLCVAISSGLFLYRLLAIFSHSDDESRMPPKVARPSNQADSVWHVELAHTATKAVVRFGDYRGAAAVWAGDCGNEVEMGSFEEHLVSLLELLCSNKCPHTYDGTLAGCVA